MQASAVGYATAREVCRLAPGDTVTVDLVLSSKQVELDEAVVTREAYSTGSGSNATLGPTEAVTTPGANGDLFRALQAFPGVASPGDGAGLFVRGGDVTETKTILDQATVYHPYRYESPAGGTFGAVRPFLVDGTEFSTGGFSAKYGDALSGVLVMESQDRPSRSQQYVNLGLAAASVSIDQPLLENELGFRFSGNRSFTGVLFRVNGQQEDYTTVPQGLDGTVSLTWDYAETSQLKLLSFIRHNRLGVETAEGPYTGVYRSETTNQLYNLQWKTKRTDWTIESSTSLNTFQSEKAFGRLDLAPKDASAKIRLDVTWSLDRWTLRTGGSVEHRTHELNGTVPQKPGVLDGKAPIRSVTASIPTTHSGAYGEAEFRMLPSLTGRVGLRGDHHTRADTFVVDPRVSVSWQFMSDTQLRASWGRYHQFPQLSTFSRNSGPTALSAQQAEHMVVGLRHETENLLLRAEAYYKPYESLVVRTGPSQYANKGTGAASGLDIFAKYGAFLETRFNGWASYSLLQSRRTQPRERGTRVELEKGPAPYDLTHQATVVGKIRVVDQVRLGGTYRYTTGRPYTPVVDTEQLESGGLFPIDGPVGSRRLPAYHRLDVQVSYYWAFNREQNVVFYTAVNNVLDRSNAIDVTYSADYAEKRYRTTDFRRSIYVGLTLTL